MKHTIVIELAPVDNRTLREMQEWVQKTFNFYHPSLGARVLTSKEAEAEGMDLTQQSTVEAADLGFGEEPVAGAELLS